MSTAKDEHKWEEQLDEEEYRILRERGTEPSGSGKYIDHDEEGVYRCAGCGQELFDSDTKFEAGHGWPSFWDTVDDDAVEFEQDTRKGMRRTEVLCSNCGGHLGHVFEDGPDPTGKRYCVNSTALDFSSREE